MKLSLNALKQIYNQIGSTDPTQGQTIDKIVEKIGAQLGEIEEVVDLGKKYDQAVIVEVVSCQPHPNADKLKLCTIDNGGNSTAVKGDASKLVQVVCGAPNVREGMLAVWLPPGATVPATYGKEPFVLEAREIRGEMSNGMLASASELGINDDHDGILEVDKKAKPGDSFAETYLLDDYIIDIENKMFTHRPDCFGLLGIAREVAGIYGTEFKSPDWYVANIEAPAPELDGFNLEIINEIPELVPRFCAVVISEANIKPSPIWMQIALSKAGIKSVNNAVDLTNFYMWLTGQPLHAYDYDKVAELSGSQPAIKIRKAKPAEKLKLLNGKEITATDGDIMIATDKKAIGLGGVIGGAETEVDSKTKNIILECANFNAYNIRRTSMNHGIFTEAVTRFTKGQSPHQNLAILSKVIGDMEFLTGGLVASKLIDKSGDLKPNKPIKVTSGFINDRLGSDLTDEQIISILKNVEFNADKKTDSLTITAPFWRTDIEISEDIVEEVGRLYGYDHLPMQLPKKTMSPASLSEELELKKHVRESLAALGANELLNYSFVRGDMLESVGQDKTKSYKIKNALSPELEYYRQSLTPSLLEKVHANIKAGFDNFAVFETGKTHIKGQETDGLPDEFSSLGLVVASKGNRADPAFYTARKYLIDLLEKFNIDEHSVVFEPLPAKNHDPKTAYYLQGRSAIIKVDGEAIGTIGEYSSKVVTSLKLPEFCAGFEVDTLQLKKPLSQNTYQPLSRYPGADQDICLKTAKTVEFAKIKQALLAALGKNAPDDVNYQVECIDIFSGGDKSKQTTFRVSSSSYDRTLTSEVINLLFEKTAIELKKSIDADIV